MHTILISGFGKIGIAHCKSFVFSKRSYRIYLHDKKFDFENRDLKKLLKSKKCEFYFVKKIPKLKFNLIIISTNADERYKITSEVIKKKLSNFLLLEKFLFNNISEYRKIQNLGNNIFLSVNTWGEYIFDMLKLKKYIKKKKITINYYLPSGTLLTNLIHILDFFSSLTSSNNFLIKENITKIIKSKRKGYHEIIGKVSFANKRGVININTNYKKKYHLVKLIIDNKILFLKINQNGKCMLYNEKKIIKKINFPFSSIVTEKRYLNKVQKRKTNTLKPNFNKISKISILILKLLNAKGRKIKIT